PFDVDRLGQPADLEHGIRAHDLVIADLDTGGLEGLEARQRDRDFVGARADELDVVVPVRVRRRLVRVLGAYVVGRDLRARNEKIAAVGYRADQRGLRSQLRPRAGGEKQPETQKRRDAT